MTPEKRAEKRREIAAREEKGLSWIRFTMKEALESLDDSDALALVDVEFVKASELEVNYKELLDERETEISTLREQLRVTQEDRAKWQKAARLAGIEE